MTASMAALVSFEESGALLHELAGVEVSVKQVERAAEALGAEIAVDERQDVEGRRSGPTMYLGLDGTGVPMRPQEVADRAGKQADGSAKTRQAKLVTVWTAESRDREGKPADQDRSAIRVRFKAPPLRIPAPTCRILPRAYSARPAAAVSPKACVRWCWAMARPGLGTGPPNCFCKPLRFSIAFMPKNISAKWERSFMETAPRARHGSMHVVRSLTKVT